MKSGRDGRPGEKLFLSGYCPAATSIIASSTAPLEASGTSGMKAAVNGVPQLSVLDGWWLEGCIEGVTGWAIGNDPGAGDAVDSRAGDADSMYRQLHETIVPLYYRNRDRWIDVMRQAIALNGSFFNTERMIDEYVRKAYGP